MASIGPSFRSEQIDLLDKILTASTEPIYVIDRAGRYWYASPAGLAALGQPAEAVVGKSWRELNVSTDGMDGHDAQRESVFQTGIPVKGEMSFPTPQGIRHYEYVISPILGKDGAIDAVTSTHRDMTERKQAEVTLQEKQHQIQQQLAEIETIYQSAPIGLNVLDSELRFVRINQRLADMNGLPVEAHIGRTIREVLPNVADLAEQLLRPILTTGEPLLNVEITGETLAQPGVQRTWIESFLPLKEGDRVIGISTVCEEITDRKRTEAERQQFQLTLQEKEASYRQLFESNPQPMWVYDLETLGFLAVNAAAVAKYGYSESEFLSMTIADIRPVEEVPRLLENVTRSKEGLDFAGSWHHRLKDGRLILVDIVSHPLEFSGRRAELVLAHDVTDRQQAEAALQQRESILCLFAQYAPAGIAMFDREMRYVIASQRWADDYQLDSVESLIGRSHYDIFPEVPERWRQIHQRCLAGAIETCDEDLFVRANGMQQWISWEIRPWYTATGEIGGIIIFAVDITDRKCAEQELQSVHDSLNVALSAAEMGTWDLDLMNDKARRNLRHDQIFGYDALQPEWGHEIAKRHAHPEDVQKFDEGFQHGLRSGDVQFTARIIWSDQSIHWINVIGRVYSNQQHQPVRMAGVVMDITERKQAEAALQRNEEQLRLAFDFAQLGSWDWDLPTNQIVWNQTHFRLLGLDPETVAASYKNWRDRVHPDDIVQIEAAINHALHTHTPYVGEYRMIRPDGTLCWVIGKGQAIYDASGQPTRMIGVLLDITDRKQAEATLQQSESLLRLFAQYAPAGIAMFDREMRYVIASQRWADDYQLDSVESLIGRSHYDIFPEVPERWRQIHQRCLAGAIETCDEDLFVRVDGTQQWIRWEVRPWYTAADDIGGIIVFSEDITQRKQAEASIFKLNQELQQRLAELQTLLEVIPIGIGIAEDSDCHHIRVNPAFAQALNIPPTVNASLSAPEEERPTHFKVYQNGQEMAIEDLPLQYAAKHGVEVRDLEVEVIWQDGTAVTLLEYAAPLFNEHKQPRGSVGAFLNITERKRAEQALRESEERYRALIQNFPNGAVCLFDHDLRYVLAEGRGLAEVGLDHTMLEGKTIWDALDSLTCRLIAPYYQAALAGQSHTAELPFADRLYRVDFLPLYNEQGQVKLGMAMSQDITLQKQAEQVLTTARNELERQVQERTWELRQLTEELQRSNHELEQFAYVASHDLQEPLRAITSFTQLLAKRYRGRLDAKADTYIEFIVDGAIRMQQLVKALLTYSRVGRHEMSRQSVDCHALLERVKQDLQVAIAENRAVITAGPLPTITADPTQMANLLQNLISNALKYRSDADPQIHISAQKVTEAVDQVASQDSSSNSTTPVPEWLFSIQDNGIGIEPQYSERIFGIFQRLHTSDEYSGTGLGLAICRKIVERHEGRIWVESQLGQGATFCFTIPISMRTQDDYSRQITQDSAS